MSAVNVAINRNVNDDPADFDFLFKVCQDLRNRKTDIIDFDFTGCEFLRQNAVVILGALVRLLQKQGNTVKFRLNTIIPRVRTNLEQNGFLHQLGLGGTPWNGNSIPFREDRIMAHNAYAEYLSEKWLGKGWVRVSDRLRDHIVASVIEAYVNVFDHAESPIGIVTCGQHYPKISELRIAMVDMGLGIPATVRKYCRQPEMNSASALQWAFQSGATTKDHNNFARGNGLKLLKSFVRDNHGKLEIYSEDGYACIDDRGEQYAKRATSFQGTIVQIALMCDASRYSLPDETDSHELFF